MKIEAKPILLFLSAAAMGWLLSSATGWRLEFSYDGLGELLGNIFAAFAGAWAAFSLQERREARKEKETEHQSLLQVQFQLIGQYNKLKNIYEQAVQPYEKDPDRWISMRPGQPLVVEQLRANFAALHFLLKKHPNNLMAIRNAEESFFSAIQAINIRSELHISELQPALSAIGRSGVEITCGADAEKHIDKRLHAMMVGGTKGVFGSFGLARENLTQAIADLYKLAKERHPNEPFLRLAE